ncbi:MAG: TIGR01777 family oxidoreductase [Candidatus Methylacidiphilales bacterium]|nr:TIGR01777 family oxidoreductase [Candidatus Methylacidiphilales bacterium]
MRIGITGVTGLIGRRLAEEASKQGHTVIGFSRKPASAASFDSPLRLLSNTEPVDVSGLDVLVHLAGEPPLGFWTEAKRRRIRDSRVLTTRHLVESLAARKDKPAVFLCASGTDYYGNRGDEVLTESSSPGSGFLSEVAQDWEAEAMKASLLSIRTACLRLGLVLDDEQGIYPLMKRIFGLGLGAWMGSGRQYLPWIHVEDAARLFLHVAENQEISGPVNAVTPEPLTNRQFSEALAASQGKKVHLAVPAWALRVTLGDLSSIVLDSQRVVPTKALQSGYAFRKLC